MLKIKYGPYEAYGLIQHRIQKIRGLIHCLSALGYEVELIEIAALDRLVIEMADRPVFMCSLQHLGFNRECQDDPVCQKAVAAVQEANIRFNDVSNVPIYRPIELGARNCHLDQKKEIMELLTECELLYEIKKQH
ncbi:unnamed protein product [Acanthoscelides obtectus]|uniref:Uncharacterized protein n=1 Tax=Acanthoscelides obtectus TaxID=200917 RepID=A0A9P0P923_ACAOB|nr:unnamed protein product [Acanthoscelides obtectus]CAK1654657.1 UPF0728 protein [Acanthoscelides obtectus]